MISIKDNFYGISDNSAANNLTINGNAVATDKPSQCELDFLDIYKKTLTEPENSAKLQHTQNEYLNGVQNLQTMQNEQHDYIMSPQKIPKNPGDNPEKLLKFRCECCKYSTDSQKDYNKHKNTKKHAKLMKDYIPTGSTHSDSLLLPVEETTCGNNIQVYTCKCGSSYKHAPSLARHRRSCQSIQTDNTSQLLTLTSIVTSMLNTIIPTLYAEMKKDNQIINFDGNNCQTKQIINQTNNTINNTQINDNKSFNLNLFLNDTCKNAINLTDFVNDIVVTIADLERTGEIGYAGGISALFIDRLNELDQEDRPMHCSDSKRHTLFVRSNNKWEREEIARQLLLKAIKELAAKSMKKIIDWKKLHPEHNDPESKQNDHYNQIMLNSMSGGTKEESEANYEKIFNNVVKNVVIDKKRLKFNNS
jgi:hypothetical protein